MDIDYEFGEETLQRAEAINKHLAEGTLPEPINDPFWCNDCPYVHICRPPIHGTEVEIMDDQQFAAMLDRLDELKPYVDEYKQIDDQLKKILEGKEKASGSETGWSRVMDREEGLRYTSWDQRKVRDGDKILEAEHREDNGWIVNEKGAQKCPFFYFWMQV